MPNFSGSITSRLPHVGTTIFTVMSRLAADLGALNLSQGYPEFSASPVLFELVDKYMRAGANQYAPMAGVPQLRELVADKVEALYGTRYDPEHEVTITAGGTEALFSAMACLVHPGDEVILLEPAYDAYGPAVELCGGTPVRVQLHPPDYRPDWEAVRQVITPRTRALFVNSPHNPTGSSWDPADLRGLADLLRGTNVVVVSDEVYEHIVFDGRLHQSCARLPELAARSLVFSSFGKTCHVTGWKVGYVVAPRELTLEFRRAHQFITFSVNTPVQLAFAEYLRDASRYLELGAFYERKRDLFRAGIETTRFRLLPCTGTYFQCVDYSRITDEPDGELAKRLTHEIGVASIPVSAFFEHPPEERILRFCFAKNDDTLARACERLASV
jgi:methionine aminotransferase